MPLPLPTDVVKTPRQIHREIIEEAARRQGIPPDLVTGKSRRHPVLAAQTEAMIRIWNTRSTMTLSQIAQIFNRTPQTMAEAFRRAGISVHRGEKIQTSAAE